MTIPVSGILHAVLNHAKATGLVNAGARISEYKTQPPNGLCFAVWIENLGAAKGGGLATTNGSLPLMARLYFPAFHKPEADVEIKIAEAADAIMGRLNGDFTLGGLVREVDLLGMNGEEMQWTFGHAAIDAKVSRIADLQIIPTINDAWTQSE